MRPLAAGGDAALALDKALQKALQDGYASFERAAEYVLQLAGEPQPDGRRRHEHLLALVLAPSPRRPPLAPDLAADLAELRRFRHVAMHGYATFDLARAEPSVAAARRVAAALPGAMEAFGRGFGLLPGAAGLPAEP